MAGKAGETGAAGGGATGRAAARAGRSAGTPAEAPIEVPAEAPTGKPERAPPAVPRLDRVLHALSDPARLAIAARLRRDGECSCAALDGGRPKSTMSHHFRVLREAGVVETSAHGVTHLNRLRREALDAAFPGLLDAVLDAAGPIS